MTPHASRLTPHAIFIRKLLLLLCRYPFDETNLGLMRKLISEVPDWNELTSLINSHGISALAAYNIKECGLEKAIPADAMAKLENGYRQSLIRNAWLTERWKEVNRILNNAGIKHIVLKGMALEHTIYGSKGLRQMSDNDILLKREDCLNAWNLLQKEGFVPEPDKSVFHRKILLEIGKHLPSLYKDGYSVEIHHRLSDYQSNGAEGSEDLFSDAVEITIGGERAFALSAKNNLSYLITHFEKHMMEGNCQIRMYADLMLSDKTNISEFPDNFILNPCQEMSKSHRKSGFRATVRSVPAPHRLRFVLGDIFPSLMWMKKRYQCNSGKAMLYYPARIAKLLWLM